MAATETRTTIGNKYLNQMGGRDNNATATTFATTIAAHTVPQKLCALSATL